MVIRKRLQKLVPGDDPSEVYQRGNGLDLPFESGRFDVVTMWNLLEHVSDAHRLLSEAARILTEDGCLFLVCPNYLSIRDEPHYHILWPSLIPRSLGRIYLKCRGKNTKYFDESVFYRTNWGVLGALRKCGMKAFDVRTDKLLENSLIRRSELQKVISALRRFHLLWIVRAWLVICFYNPFKHSVELIARRKKSTS